MQGCQFPAGSIAFTVWSCCNRPGPAWAQAGHSGVHFSAGTPGWGQPAPAGGHGWHCWQAAWPWPLVHSCTGLHCGCIRGCQLLLAQGQMGFSHLMCIVSCSSGCCNQICASFHACRCCLVVQPGLPLLCLASHNHVSQLSIFCAQWQPVLT